MTVHRVEYVLHGVSISVTAASRRLRAAADELLCPFATATGPASTSSSVTGAPRIAVKLLSSAPPDSPPARARTWMEADGLCLLADGATSYLLFEGVYYGRLAHRERRITLWLAHDHAPDNWTIAHMLLQPLVLEALRPNGFIAVHAAALVDAGAAVLFPAYSGSGKTTLALALLRAGFRLLSDDSPLLRCEEGLVVAYAFPEPLNVAATTAALFAEVAPHLPAGLQTARAEKAALDARLVYGDCLAERAPVRAIILPARRPAGGSTLSCPLPKAQALLRLLPLTMTSAAPANTSAQFQLLAHLVRDTPCYSMDTGGDFDRIPSIVRRLLRDDGAV
jgi:hypothetical protein